MNEYEWKAAFMSRYMNRMSAGWLNVNQDGLNNALQSADAAFNSLNPLVLSDPFEAADEEYDALTSSV